MTTCADALEEAVKHHGGVVKSRQILDYIKRKYPDDWKNNTIRSHIIGCSVNHSSSHHYRYFRKFLFAVGPGQVRLYNSETDGKWKWTPTGMIKIGSGDERDEDSTQEPENDSNAFIDILKRYFEGEGYETKLHTTVHENRLVDLLVEKENETLAIEVKNSSRGIYEVLAQSEMFRIIPEIDLLYIAAPGSILEQDVLNFAKLRGVGVLGITGNEIEKLVDALATSKAHLSEGSSYPTSTVPGQIFSLSFHIENTGGKIARNIETSYIPVDPFIVPPGEVSKKKVDKLFPHNRISSELIIKVKEDTETGWYPLFTKRSAQDIELKTSIIQIEVRPKREEYVQNIVAKAVQVLNNAISTNIDNALHEIDRAVMDGYINLEDHVIDKSIWNTIAMPCLDMGLSRQAEKIYGNMLTTIRKYENENVDVQFHKGLALHNLGMALYYQGKREEAKERFQEAFEEDKISFGEEAAIAGLAKRALDELFLEEEPK